MIKPTLVLAFILFLLGALASCSQGSNPPPNEIIEQVRTSDALEPSTTAAHNSQ